MAVYTEVADDELRTFVAEYDIGAVVSCKGIAEGVENSNFLLQTDHGNFILTLYEKRVAHDDLPFFLQLMEHLSAAGLPCPVPIHGRDGRALRALASRPAAIVTFLQGLWPRRIDLAHCAELGAGLARMHLAGASFSLRRPNSLSLDGWRHLIAATAPRADEVQPGLAAELQRELDSLVAEWPRDLPTGVIHADLFPDNVFFIDGHLSGIIDFYFACTDFLAYDIAVCLNAWCFERDNSFNITKARLLLSGYRKVRPLEQAELAALPLLGRGSALRFLLTRLYDWLNLPAGALVTPKDPLEYLTKLRFHRGLRGPSGYGLDYVSLQGRGLHGRGMQRQPRTRRLGGSAPIRHHRTRTFRAASLLTTNNRMELLAAVSALEALKRPCQVKLYTDSRYVRDGISGWIDGWKRNGWRTSAKAPVKNVDLWQRLDAARGPHKVEWLWVRGHAGHPENERVDALARSEVSRLRRTAK